MKIAFLLTQSLESPSGLGRYFPLASELARLSHQVSIYALHPEYTGLSEKTFRADGVEVTYVAQMHVQKRGDLKSYYSTPGLLAVSLSATWRLARAALSSQVDVIHVGKPHPMNGLAGLLARLLKNVQFYLDCDDYEAASTRFSGEWQRIIVTGIETWLPRQAHYITTNTCFMRERLRAWGVPAGRIYYLPNGVDLRRFSLPPVEQVAARRRELGLEGRSVVLFVGSLSLPSHPVDLLLEAFQMVKAECPQAALLLVGGGEDYQHLKKRAQELDLGDDVLFLGRVLPVEVPLYYSLASVSVDPVRDDDAARGRSPLKLFESWACGVPCVTADVGDRRRLLGYPPAGRLAARVDAASLGEAILELLQDVELAQRLVHRGRERVKSYAWDVLAKQMEKIYLDNLSERKR